MCGRSWTTRVSELNIVSIIILTDYRICVCSFSLEEERELELERLYENGVVETLNHRDEQIGSGAADAENTGLTLAPTAEATSVSKQTAETLTAGEKSHRSARIGGRGTRHACRIRRGEVKAFSCRCCKITAACSGTALLAALDMERGGLRARHDRED